MFKFSLSIPFGIKLLWDKWNIRGSILFSLWLQVILIFVAPIRKSARQKLVISLIWLAYLLADAAANFAVGLISNSQRNPDKNADPKLVQNTDLLAFWAPFLLLHLGGPDTITAFALEDNQLWLRHLLGLFFQAGAVIYIFFQSLPNDKLMFLTVLVFFAGIIKYGERTLALYRASLDKYRDSMLKKPDPGPNYSKLMEEYAFKRSAELPTTITMTPEPDKETKASDTPPKEGPLNHLEVVHYAYQFFLTFRGLIVDLIFSFRERNESRDFFTRRSAEDALRVIEVELNFIYGSLYTKLEVVYSWLGCICRFLAFGFTLATLGLFYFKTKDEFRGVDVGITYTLLLGAIALDVIALLTIIFSDRTFALIKNPDRPHPSCWPVAFVFKIFLALKKPWWCKCKCKPNCPHQVLATPLAFRRWSGSISSHNLIRYCLESKKESIHEFPSLCLIVCKYIFDLLGLEIVFDRLTEICKVIGRYLGVIKEKLKILRLPFIKFLRLFMEDTVDELLYVSREPFTKDLWEFIFDELKKKSEFADTPETAKRISILLWHIATDLCYHAEKENGDNSAEKENGDNSAEKENGDNRVKLRHFSKTLSDYMLYLLVFQPTMMSAVAGIAKIRFGDTCEEAKRFFKSRSLRPNEDKKACEQILSVNTDVGPEEVKGDRSKSVLFSASILAKELQRMEREDDEDKWMIMSRVWVELVSYAASHCRANTHAAEVSKGGQLITFFWLLMAHFGLGEQFQINEGHARAKLNVGK
ncbi:putative Leucine-rich repeat family protein [Hibiscus syriacus]|uniref:Leucine-rich repeat family protein n=1 Tax=Hibiscus syriacus TaxID=106335 RepID=A0A6A2Y4M9_HIBSY|nr:putative Leucine-rich repeat family protein [Hibiscus syriacus]